SLQLSIALDFSCSVRTTCFWLASGTVAVLAPAAPGRWLDQARFTARLDMPWSSPASLKVVRSLPMILSRNAGHGCAARLVWPALASRPPALEAPPSGLLEAEQSPLASEQLMREEALSTGLFVWRAWATAPCAACGEALSLPR